MNDRIIEKIKNLCDKNNISINKLLQNCESGKSLVDNMKKGSIPTVDKIIKIADYFDVSIDYLVGRSNNPKSHKTQEA